MTVEERLIKSCNYLQKNWVSDIKCNTNTDTTETVPLCELSGFNKTLQEFKNKKEAGTLDPDEINELIERLHKINSDKLGIYNEVGDNYTQLTNVKNDNHYADKKLEENLDKLSNITRVNKSLLALVVVLFIISAALFGVYIKL
jgi:hypothetical protein